MPTHHYKAIIFDFDDTLVQSHVMKWAHHKATAKEFYNLELTDETLAAHWGKPFDELLQLLYQNADTVENMRAANFSIEHRFRKIIQPDALKTLERLQTADCRLGVLSAMDRPYIESELKEFGFGAINFLFIQGAGDTTVHKPHPGVFKPALRLLRNHGIQAADTLYVGDALSDFEAARGAGVDFIGVTTGRTTAIDFASVEAKSVTKLSDLLNTKRVQSA